jgi:hypothetical protein
MRADSAVEPTKSENITVTWRRSARSSGRVLGVFDVVAGSRTLVLVLIVRMPSALGEPMRRLSRASRYKQEKTHDDRRHRALGASV